MPIKTLVSPLALAIGLSLTGAAAAQTAVGTQDIEDADLPAVEEHCETLALAGDVGAGFDAEGGTEAEGELTGDDPLDAEGGMDAEAGMDANGGMDAGAGVDLESITLQDCIDAGLVDDPDAMDTGVNGDAGAEYETDVDTGVDADLDADVDLE